MWPYSYLMSGSSTGGGHYVELLETRLIGLLQRMLVLVEVDEAWYRTTYRDVDEAIRAGHCLRARALRHLRLFRKSLSARDSSR